MSALIKGMEMPKRCEDCLLCNQYETVTMIACGCLVNMRTRELGCVTRPDWCPIMEVHDHGRLIDAEKFAAVMHERYNNAYSWYTEAEDPEIKYRAASAVASFTECSLTLSKMPTVIPADRKEQIDGR